MAFPHEEMQRPCDWLGKIQFEVISNSDFMMTWTSFLPDLEREKAEALLGLVGARYPFSPNYQKLKGINQDIVFKNGEEWVFFGGSFYPWHQGHQACLDLINQSKTCFLIPDRNPLKELRELDPITTVLELSSKIRFRKNQFMAPTFLLDHRKNPTVEWIEKLRRDFPEKKLSLLMGFDSLASIRSWTRVQDLLPLLYSLYVVSRLETEGQRKTEAKSVKELAPDINIEFLGHHAFERFSSTEIRKRMS